MKRRQLTHAQPIQVESLAEDHQLLTLCRKIERDRGFFCSSYKDTCLRRRISVRMRVKGASSFQQYSEILDADPLEYERLIATLTINVSKFFRNPEIYESIAAKVLPEIARPTTPVVRIWSAGFAREKRRIHSRCFATNTP